MMSKEKYRIGIIIRRKREIMNKSVKKALIFILIIASLLIVIGATLFLLITVAFASDDRTNLPDECNGIWGVSVTEECVRVLDESEESCGTYFEGNCSELAKVYASDKKEIYTKLLPIILLAGASSVALLRLMKETESKKQKK